MAVERFEVNSVDELEDGRKVSFSYRDSFDPKAFVNIVLNPSEDIKKRDDCARRLINAKVLTAKRLNKLIRSSVKVSPRGQDE